MGFCLFIAAITSWLIMATNKNYVFNNWRKRRLTQSHLGNFITDALCSCVVLESLQSPLFQSKPRTPHSTASHSLSLYISLSSLFLCCIEARNAEAWTTLHINVYWRIWHFHAQNLWIFPSFYLRFLNFSLSFELYSRFPKWILDFLSNGVALKCWECFGKFAVVYLVVHFFARTDGSKHRFL